ncbi:MAG: hypothetical protein IKW83_06510 [Muribaculaceae bacterium]|nr:hypothetical protein [Muribaculaceae bacterium]
MKITKSFLLSFLVLGLLMGCDFFPLEPVNLTNKVIFENHSNDSIVVCLRNYPDTLLNIGDNSLFQRIEIPPHDRGIFDATNAYDIVNYYYKLLVETDDEIEFSKQYDFDRLLVCLFVIDKKAINQKGWANVCESNDFIERYDVSLRQLRHPYEDDLHCDTTWFKYPLVGYERNRVSNIFSPSK